MKALLVALNASYVHTNLAVRLLRASTSRPVDVLEMTINESKEAMIQKILRKRPDVIMYSAYIWNWTQIGRLGRYIKKALPEIRQYAGGPEVTYDCVEIMEEARWLDGILRGEGEKNFDDFLAYLGGEKTPESVSGLVWRGKEAIVASPFSKPGAMDGLPCGYDQESLEHRIVYYESMRGCPYHCSYCLSSEDDQVRYRSVAEIKRHMRLLFQTKTRLIKFVDRSFHIRPERTKEILRFFIDEAPEDMCIHFEMNLEHMTRDVADLMNRAPAGRFQIEAGIQSVNPQVNQRIHRSTNLNKMKAAMDWIDREKIHIHVDLIAGLPGETMDSFLQGFDRVVPLKAQKIQIGFLKLLRGTELRRRADEFHIIYDDEPPYEVIRTDALGGEEVLLLKNFATIVEQYYDEDAFLAVRGELENRSVIPSSFYMAMARAWAKEERAGTLNTQKEKYRFLYHCLKENKLWDEVMYYALKEDFYFSENRYIGGVLPIDDPEIDRETVVAFLKNHPEFTGQKDPLKASKQVRGIFLRDKNRYILYENGKYKRHLDERNIHG
ncbi:MAG: DUF4080 domain-containing protein [Peptoniphilus sp.]|nr:DUF4080 domain-containing protein [Peptoniphilus sp.]MDY3118499.1 DUF4080 domain-containing protein [Peptoniphilus sp.]